jgi:hypothetical protein
MGADNQARPSVQVLAWLCGWGALAFALHLVWEVAHLPLYTLAFDENALRRWSYLLHCTAGDVLIATSAFLAAVLATRRLDWILTEPVKGGIVLVLSGLLYTVLSEWHNVYHAGSWAYTPAMPLVGGVGLTPLLQWLVLPILMLGITRAVVQTKSAH